MVGREVAVAADMVEVAVAADMVVVAARVERGARVMTEAATIAENKVLPSSAIPRPYGVIVPSRPIPISSCLHIQICNHNTGKKFKVFTK